MNKLIIADFLTLPIDEGLKKFTFNFMKYALTRNDVAVYSSPGDIGLDGVRLYRANKLMCSNEIKRLLNAAQYRSVYYIPEASSTFNSFIRTWMLKRLVPAGTDVVMISIQRREHKLWQRFLMKFLGKFNVICFSQSASSYLQSLGVNANFETVGVDGEIYRPVDNEQKMYLREKYDVAKEAKVILHVGHIRRRRNILMLKVLQEKGYQVIIVGSTSMAYEEDVANELLNSGVKIFKEYNPHIEELYQLSDVYVFPVLRADGAIEFPLSVLEAMACELPIVTTLFGALKDRFEETSGFQFWSTEDELVDKVNELYGKRYPENRDIVLSDYSWNKIFEKTLNKR